MPDGVIVQNVPDDITQSELLRRYQAMKAPQVSDPTDGMSFLDKAAAGAGKAMVDTYRGVKQLLGADNQAEIDEAQRLDAPLMATGGGLTGNVIGNLATMVGPGAALGAVGKAAKLPMLVNAARAAVAPQTVLGGAAAGAGMSALQPVATGESRAFNTALGGVVGGVGQGIANTLGSALGSKAAQLTPEQMALVQRAQDLGFQLKPSELTGKRWQQNLEAVMAQMPSTAGKMQAIGAENRANTSRLVEQALGNVGGAIDQPSAAAAGVEGFEQGMSSEQGRLGAAYRNLLDDVDVNLEAARPALEGLRKGQQQLPKSSQSGPGMESLSDLLGSPDYVKRAPKRFGAVAIDPSQDDIVTAIRKLGGINPNDERIGMTTAKGLDFGPNPRIGPVWSTKGKPLDDMAEALAQYGYVERNGLDDIMEKLSDTHTGVGRYFSDAFDYGAQAAQEDPLTAAISGLTRQLGEKSKPGPSAGYIRNKSPVSGDVAQALRSDYTDQSANQSLNGRDRRLFAGMKAAVDDAIEQALPATAQGQFQAINRRYGIYAGLNAISPKQQNTFLAQLYRGSDSPDQFYTFLGMAPEGKFKEVARGFVTRLIDSATDKATGEVNATALSRVVDKANPDALRYLGGNATPLLRDIGNIGRSVLREQTGNPGTAQRMLYQSLLTGSGLGLGGYLGSQQGGSPGAVIGSAVGAFALPKAAQAAYLSKALRPLLTAGTKGRKGLLSDDALELLIPLLARSPTAGLLSLSQ